jgi:hypothetical protein
MLGGCPESAPSPSVIERPNLPGKPALFGVPVAVPQPKAGQDARLYAAQTRKSVIEANARLRNDGTFYDDVRRDFGAPTQ